MGAQSNASVAKTGNDPFLIIVKWLSTVSGWFSATMIVLAVGITCQMIFVRFVLNHSTVWQTEAVVYLMIGATLIGLPYVQYLRGHVNVDLIPLALKPRPRFILCVISIGASIAIVSIMLFYGFGYWHIAWSRGWTSDTVWAFPLWIPYMSIPIGFGLLLLQLIGDLYAVLKGIDTPFSLGE